MDIFNDFDAQYGNNIDNPDANDVGHDGHSIATLHAGQGTLIGVNDHSYIGDIATYDGHTEMQNDIMNPQSMDMSDYLQTHGNCDEIMNYSDPLLHSSEYRMDPFNAGHITNPNADIPNVHVSPYLRSGTWVEGHMRTEPDRDVTNNLSYHPKK